MEVHAEMLRGQTVLLAARSRNDFLLLGRKPRLVKEPAHDPMEGR